MRPLKDEFKADLCEVQRDWIRVPTTLVLIIPVLTAAILIGVLEACRETWKTFTLPCLRGPEL